MMTTNIAESLNSMLKDPRELPIISLLETIRLTLTQWFYERREKGKKHDKYLTPNVMKTMVSRYDKAMTYDVYQVNVFEFEVIDDKKKFVVNLERRSCSCCVFDIDRIPCSHAIAAAKRSHVDENRLADAYYCTDTFSKAYAESIHPNGDVSTWSFPEDISGFLCPPPGTKPSSGRPPKKRKKSAGEYGVPASKCQRYKCTRCGKDGHNKRTCKSPL